MKRLIFVLLSLGTIAMGDAVVAALGNITKKTIKG